MNVIIFAVGMIVGAFIEGLFTVVTYIKQKY